MDIIDIRLPKSLLVSKKSSEIVPGLVVDEQGSVSLITWINSRITDGSISSIGGGSPSAAENISVTPSGNLASTDVQAALLELQSDINNFSVGSSDAADITVVASGNLASTNVQAALLELQGDIDSLAGGGADGNGIYDGNGTLTSTTTVNGDSNALVFNTLSNFQVTTLSSGFIMNTNEGIRYNADYSSNFSARSLVDKAYVDSVIPSSAGSVTTDGTVITGDGTEGSPISLDGMGASNAQDIISWDTDNSRWRSRNLTFSGNVTTTQNSTTFRVNTTQVTPTTASLDAGNVIIKAHFMAFSTIAGFTMPSVSGSNGTYTIDAGHGLSTFERAFIYIPNLDLLPATFIVTLNFRNAEKEMYPMVQFFVDNELIDFHGAGSPDLEVADFSGTTVTFIISPFNIYASNQVGKIVIR